MMPAEQWSAQNVFNRILSSTTKKLHSGNIFILNLGMTKSIGWMMVFVILVYKIKSYS